MLQFDRQSVGSKFIRGSQSKPPTNFLSRNKRAIRDKSRSIKDAQADSKVKGRPRSKRALERERRKDESVAASGNGGSVAKKQPPPAGSDTVTISKSYLDELLRMSVMRDDSSISKETSRDITKSEAPSNRHNALERVTVEPTHVPGLDLTSPQHTISPPPPHQRTKPHTEHAQKIPTAVQVNNPCLSPREKWLQDLAAQVEEQKAKKEKNRLRERQPTVEEYFPFGRPGGGAPIRSQSGQLLTDYRSRTRYQDEKTHQGAGGSHLVAGGSHHGAGGSRVEADQDSGLLAPNEYPPKRPAYDEKVPSSFGGTYSIGGGVSTNTMMSPRHHETQSTPLHSTTPRFARGAGPHVDQYMMEEMNEKRRKQMENMEFIRQQVAEKERIKMEEKLRREREDAIEEAKLAAERERMKMDFEREKEKGRRKELEARQRQALLQQRILEAEESARQAKLGAKRESMVTAAHHPTVSFDEDYITRHSPVDYGSGDAVYSSISKSELRSPSMLQLVNTSTDNGRHGDNNAPPTQRGQANPVRKSRQFEKGGNVEQRRREAKRKGSRIPVMQTSPTPAVKSKIITGARAQTRNTNKTETNVRNSKRFRDEDQRSVKVVKATRGGPVVERSRSPPLPVVARKLKEQNYLPKKDNLCLSKSRGKTSRNDENYSFVRSVSPPVPTVAKKLRNGELSEHLVTEVVRPPYERTPSPPVPAVAKKLRSGLNHTTSTEVMPAVYERTLSPPIPTVAKRLKQVEANVISETTTERQTYVRASSPPVPAVVKRLQQEKSRQAEEEITMGGKSKSAPTATVSKRMETDWGKDKDLRSGGDQEMICDLESDNAIQLPINRPPSCKPDSKPLSPVAMTTSSLPAITTATSNHHHDNSQTMYPPRQSSNRQRLILQQLNMLKEGILTQQNSIDHRVQTILTRNKKCSF